MELEALKLSYFAWGFLQETMGNRYLTNTENCEILYALQDSVLLLSPPCLVVL